MRLLSAILFLCFFSSISFAQKEIKYAAVVENGWWEVIDNKGKIVVDSLVRSGYDNYVNEHFFKTSNGLYPFVRNGNYGFKDHQNKVVVPCQYKYMFPSVNGCTKVGTNALWHLINSKGKVIASSVDYDYASDASGEGLIVVRKGEDIACIDTKGEIVIPFYYKTDVKFYPYPQFEDGLLRVMVKQPKTKMEYLPRHFDEHNYKIGFVDSKGRLVIDTLYRLQDAMVDYRERQEGGFCGGCGTGMQMAERIERAQDTADRFILANEYYHFDGGICLVNVDRKNVVINTKGDSLFIVSADRNIRCSQGYLLIESSYYSDLLGSNNYYSATIINSVGNTLYRGSGKILENKREKDSGIVIEMAVSHELSRSNYRGGVYKLLNTKNGIMIKDSFLQVEQFAGAYARVLPFGKNSRIEEDWVAIDEKGNVLPLARTNISYLHDGGDNGLIIAHTIDNRQGYVDRLFRWRIGPAFDKTGVFSHGLAAVKMPASKWGYINKKGKMIISARFDEATPFQTLKIK